MNNLKATVSLIVNSESGESNYYCRVEIEFPGTYENGEVPNNIEIITDQGEPYPVNIQYLTDEGKLSESGSILTQNDFLLEVLPWGATESEYIDILVAITDSNSQTIKGGGVISQSEPTGASKPIKFNNR